MLQYFLSYGSGVYVHVDFGGAYALVPQHGLYGTQVGTALEQWGGKGGAQGVGRDGFSDACLHSLLFYHNKNHGAREMGATAVEKQDRKSVV